MFDVAKVPTRLSWRSRLINWFMAPGGSARIVRYGYMAGQHPSVLLCITTMGGEIIGACTMSPELVDQAIKDLTTYQAKMRVVRG